MQKIEQGRPFFIECEVCEEVTDHYAIREPIMEDGWIVDEAWSLWCEPCMLSLQ